MNECRKRTTTTTAVVAAAAARTNEHTWNIFSKPNVYINTSRGYILQPRPLTAISYYEQLKQMIICTWHVEFFDFHYIFICVCVFYLLYVSCTLMGSTEYDRLMWNWVAPAGWESFGFGRLSGKCVFTFKLIWHYCSCDTWTYTNTCEVV